jgi:hypothetical protein
MQTGSFPCPEEEIASSAMVEVEVEATGLENLVGEVGERLVPSVGETQVERVARSRPEGNA